MKLVGFNFNKISAEKLKEITEAPKIESSMDISKIKEIQSQTLKVKETLIIVGFKYDLLYNPNFAKLSFLGDVIFSVDSKKAKEILKKWEGKELSNEFKTGVFNIILRKSNIKAIQLEDELNLPLHFRMPSLKLKDQEENKK